MAGFRYEAIDALGKVRRGVVEVDSPRQARQTLREQGLIAVEVHALTQATLSTGGQQFRLRRGLPTAQLSLLTRQFATLSSANLTVEQTLNALIEQAETQFLRQVLAGVRGEVLAGQTLARAMSKFPDVFPELYRTLIDAGERSGQLAEVMLRLADYTEERQALKQKVGLAFIYPVIVTVVAVAVVLGLLTYVVPQVVAVFINTNQSLPLLTRALIALSDFMRDTGVFWLVGLVAGTFVFRRSLREPAMRHRFHLFLLRLPLFGKLIRGMNTARLASTLAILVGSGVPLLTALQAGVGVVSNLPMRKALEEAERMVREGGSLSRSIGRSKMFPPLMVHLIASGEASGRLDNMLERAAKQQTQEMENQVAALTSLIEPILILVMGVVVLIIVLAILLPIFELNTLVR
ncbi:MAG: type II secretion system inner membrane protein GspF [Burkholderiales bacterium]|nr:type II secretion system inner membrane protein GspF [Burkholderiales bacterium]MDQ3195511.1 type II secretion system inner membrane protein GspF [Pseudomonadota bacterium]